MKRPLIIILIIFLFGGSLYYFYLNRPKGKVFSSSTNFPSDLETANLITFISDRDGNDEIYLTDKQGLFIKRITNTSQKEFSPDFSPSTREIAYLSENPDYTGIWLYSLANQNKRLLNISREKPSLLNYSPDGQFLALWEANQTTEENGDLFVIRIRDGKINRLATNVGNFSWSVDSKTIVYTKGDPKKSILETKILVKNIFGEETQTPVEELVVGGLTPVFLTANKIIFLEVTGELLKLVSMSLRGENREELLNLGIRPQEEANYFLSVSPSEDQIILQISFDKILFEPLLISLRQKTIEKLTFEAKSLKWGEKGEIIFTAKDERGNSQLWLKEQNVLSGFKITTKGNNWF